MQIAWTWACPSTGSPRTFAGVAVGHTDLREAARRAWPRAILDPDAFADKVEQALYASKIVSYAQGLDMIAAGGEVRLGHRPRQDGGHLARRRIVRAAFLDRIRAAYAANRQLPTLLADPDFARSPRRRTPGAR